MKKDALVMLVIVVLITMPIEIISSLLHIGKERLLPSE